MTVHCICFLFIGGALIGVKVLGVIENMHDIRIPISGALDPSSGVGFVDSDGADRTAEFLKVFVATLSLFDCDSVVDCKRSVRSFLSKFGFALSYLLLLKVLKPCFEPRNPWLRNLESRTLVKFPWIPIL